MKKGRKHTRKHSVKEGVRKKRISKSSNFLIDLSGKYDAELKTGKKKKKRISKSTNYKIGRNFEYRVKRYYENLGYFVVRSYASKGAADLYCMKPLWIDETNCYYTELLLIQCKNYKGNLKDAEIEGLQLMAQATGGTPIHVWKDEKRELKDTLIEKKHHPLSFRGILDRLKELKKRLRKKQ